jgi:hypothetical protein
MPINAQGYFDQLRSYMNMKDYGLDVSGGRLILTETVFTAGNQITMTVKLKVDGQAFAIRLDKKTSKGGHQPLFHFFDDTSKPWARRCDFVIFSLVRNRLQFHCIEFKSETINSDSIASQLNAGTAWCKTVCSAVRNYTGKSKRVHILKYVFSMSPNPEVYLEDTGKYLKADQSIRHHLYRDIDGKSLGCLDNACSDSIG